MEQSVNKLDGFNRNTIHNRPQDRGTIPGTRVTHRYYAGQDGSTLSDHTEMIFNVVGAGRVGAYIGNSAKIITRMTVKHGSTNYTDQDLFGLRDEAHNMLWESITLAVNGGAVNHHQRTDVTHHIKDRFLTTSGNRYSYGNYRLVKEDKNLKEANPAEIDRIIDGRTFEIIRPLDDLPFCNEKDGLIPSFLNLRIMALSGVLKKMFSTTNPLAVIRDTTPTVTLIECFLTIDWVGVEQLVIDDWEKAYIADQLQMDTTRWYTHREEIPSGTTNFDTKSTIGLHNVPNAIICQIYSNTDFSNGTLSDKHPLRNDWGGIDYFSISNNAGDIVRYRHLKRGKSEPYMALEGLVLGMDKTTPQYEAFEDGTVGCLSKVYRAVDEMLTQPTQLADYRVSMVFEPATLETFSMYMVSIVREGYLITQGGARMINLVR